MSDILEIIIAFFNILVQKSPIILSILVLFLLILLYLFWKYHRSIIQKHEQSSRDASIEIFNLKNSVKNTATLIIYPTITNSVNPNYSIAIKCDLIVTPFYDFGDYFAIRLNSTTEVHYEDSNKLSLNPTFVGGFYEAKISNDLFVKSMKNYYKTTFFVYTNNNSTDLSIEIANPNINGKFKFNLHV